MKEPTQEDFRRILAQLTPEDQRLLSEWIGWLVDNAKTMGERVKEIMNKTGFKPGF